MRFSVIIPTYNRAEQVIQAIKSVASQSFVGDNLEIIVVDDGSTDETASKIATQFGNPWEHLRIVTHDSNLGKTFARNTGLRAARGEWICELDSDDTYHPRYLETFAELIKENPETNVFTCGASVYNFKSRSFSTRSVFVPQKAEVFASGRIGTGSFIYRRALGPIIPESRHPYGGDTSFSAYVQKQIPEIRELYGQNAEGQWKALGNPFGDDYVKFFMLTRENSVVGVNLPLYLQNVR